MSGRPWIEHDGTGCPLPRGAKCEALYEDGHKEVFVTEGEALDLTPFDSQWHWAGLYRGIHPSCKIIAYRLSDTDDKAKRQARMADFYKIAAGRDHLIEETLKTRKPVSAPQKAGE